MSCCSLDVVGMPRISQDAWHWQAFFVHFGNCAKRVAHSEFMPFRFLKRNVFICRVILEVAYGLVLQRE
jgi:hypothetical protein